MLDGVLAARIGSRHVEVRGHAVDGGLHAVAIAIIILADTLSFLGRVPDRVEGQTVQTRKHDNQGEVRSKSHAERKSKSPRIKS